MIASCWMFGFVIVGVYTANLAANRTLNLGLKRNIETLDDLRKRHKVRYSIIANSSTFKYFSRMKETEGFVLVSDDSFLRNLLLNIICLIYNLPNIYLCLLFWAMLILKYWYCIIRECKIKHDYLKKNITINIIHKRKF